MKRFIHLNESEFRNFIKGVIREAEEEKSTDTKREKSSFLVCSEDFKDFDAIMDIIDALDGTCEEESKGVYRIKCKTKEDAFTIKKILASFDKDSLNNNFSGGQRTGTHIDYMDDIATNEPNFDDFDDINFDFDF